MEGHSTFEPVAVDNSDPNMPILTSQTTMESCFVLFQIRMDWTPCIMEQVLVFMYFIDDQNFEWTSSIHDAGRHSAQWFYPNSEGILYFDGLLYFVSKEMQTLYSLDLVQIKYQREDTGGSHLLGHGSFNAQPDQIFIRVVSKQYLYFTEDCGSSSGIFAHDKSGAYYTVLQGTKGVYDKDNTVGIPFTQDRTRLYTGLRIRTGILLELTRDDVMPH